MTKKDFELIARVIRADAAHTRDDGTLETDYKSMPAWMRGAYDQWNTLALNMADALATTNPRFDRARFLQACGIDL